MKNMSTPIRNTPPTDSSISVLEGIGLFVGIPIGVVLFVIFILAPSILLLKYCEAMMRREEIGNSEDETNNDVDIKRPQEETKLVTAKNNAQAPGMYGMFPPFGAIDSGATNSSDQTSGQEQSEATGGIFPSSQFQEGATRSLKL